MGYNVWDVQKWLGYLTENEVVTLQKFADELPGGSIIINIGAGGGTSGLLFAEKLKEKSKLYTIDVQDESSPFGCLHGERRVFRRAGLSWMKDKQWFQIHSNSVAVGRSWHQTQPPVDFVFVDGDHAYDGCAGDIRAWVPNIKAGGHIAIHDYGKKDNAAFRYDVDRAVKELLIPSMYIACQMDALIVFEVDGSAWDAWS